MPIWGNNLTGKLVGNWFQIQLSISKSEERDMKRAGVLTICVALVAVFVLGDSAEASHRCGRRVRCHRVRHHSCAPATCCAPTTCCDSYSSCDSCSTCDSGCSTCDSGYSSCDSGCSACDGGCSACGGAPATGGHANPAPVNPNQVGPETTVPATNPNKAVPQETIVPAPNPNQTELRGTN